MYVNDVFKKGNNQTDTKEKTTCKQRSVKSDCSRQMLSQLLHIHEMYLFDTTASTINYYNCSIYELLNTTHQSILA